MTLEVGLHAGIFPPSPGILPETGVVTRTRRRGWLPAEVGRGLLAEFFKEGLHEAGPEV